MLRVIDWPGAPGAKASELDRCAVPPPGVHRWVDVQGPDAPTLALLGERFGLHPLALEDCAHFDQRPKLEEHDDHLFVVVHGFVACGADPAECEARELHAFLGPGWLVTVHDGSLPSLEALWGRVAAEPAPLERGADFLYYVLVDGLVDAQFPLLDALQEALEVVEEAVMSRAPTRRDLKRVFTLRRTLVTMRRTLSPQRDVLALLAKRASPVIREGTVPYFRDVYDHVMRITEGIDAGRDLLGNALDAYLSSVSNRTNEIMKRLTIFSAIFLPLSFVVGFFGMNFDRLPFKSNGVLLGALGIMLAVPVVMLVWFRRARWL